MLSASPSSLRGVWLAATTISTPSTDLAQQRRVEHRQQRRRVEHDVVVALPRLLEELLEPRRPQDLADAGARGVPAGMTSRLNGVERCDDLGEPIVRGRSARRPGPSAHRVIAELPGDRRPAQVGVDEQHALVASRGPARRPG